MWSNAGVGESSSSQRKRRRRPAPAASPIAFPRGTDGHGSDPPAKAGMGVHMPALPDADRGIPKGGVAPFYGPVPRSGNTVPAAVSQLRENQPYTEALARTEVGSIGV